MAERLTALSTSREASKNRITQLLIVCWIAAVVLWAIAQSPLDPAIQTIIRVAIIVIVCIYVIYASVPLLGRLGPPAR